MKMRQLGRMASPTHEAIQPNRMTRAAMRQLASEVVVRMQMREQALIGLILSEIARGLEEFNKLLEADIERMKEAANVG